MDLLGVSKSAALKLLNPLRQDGAVVRIGGCYYPAGAVVLPEDQSAAVTAYLAAHGTAVRKELAELLNLPPAQCTALLRRMADRGELLLTGKRYALPPKESPFKRIEYCHVCKQQKVRKSRYFRTFLHLHYEPGKSIYIPAGGCYIRLAKQNRGQTASKLRAWCRPATSQVRLAPTRNPEPGGGELQGNVSTFYQGGNPMKKFLSLVLALVMTMSLVTVSAGAKDFTDSSKIQYTEAVDVMSAAKVIDGYTDGSFNPSATLTRGAAAKIICNLILGPTTASALVADAAPYKDVPTNHTFAGYIAYCQKTGIISGYADGTFKPANSLTGYAFMKMLLGALGYKAESRRLHRR